MHTNNRKTKKRIFLFTNGMGESIHDIDYASNYISQNLKMSDIKLNIIPINFMEGYDMIENKYEYEVQFP